MGNTIEIMKRIKFYIYSIILALFAAVSGISAQVLQDTLAVNRITSGIDEMYNLEFNKANEMFSEVSRLYPDHPVNYLLSGLTTYWENYPLISTSPARENFEEDLRKCIQLSEQKPYSTQYEAESLLANICARGLLALFYSDNGLVMNVIPLVTGSYKYLMRSFDFVSTHSDLYYFTGLYNYYREAYPKIHPVYRTLASLFPSGDMPKGLNELTRATEQAIFLKAESFIILSWIYTGYENNYLKASEYSRTLSDMYPENLYFRGLHIKNLLLLNEYDQAEILLKSHPDDSIKTYFDGQSLVFRGIVQEKKYKNYSLAKQFYEEGIDILSLYGDHGDEFCGYAYFGLSRICEHNGDKPGKKSYRRKGSDLVSFKKINFD